MSLLSSVTGILFTPTVQVAEPRTFEELVAAEDLTFNDLSPQEKQILMARKGELTIEELRALKLEEAECAELEEAHRIRLQKSAIWDGRRIAVTIAKGTGVLVVGAFAAGAASVSVPVAAGLAVCSGVGYLFYLRTHSGELETRSKQLTDFVITHAQPQRIIREQLELRESERAEALDRRLREAEDALKLEKQRKAELADQLLPGKADLASGQEHFKQMQHRIEKLRAAEKQQKELAGELKTLTEQHRKVDREMVEVLDEVEQLSEALRNRQGSDKGRDRQQLKQQDLRLQETLQLFQEKVEALEDEARILTETIKEKDIEFERLNRQKNHQTTDIQALILQKKAVERDTIKPLQRRLRAAERMLMEAGADQQAIQNQLFQTQQTVRSLETEVKTVSDEAVTQKLDLERATEKALFLESQLSSAIQHKDKTYKDYLIVIDELNAVRMQLESSQMLQHELENQLEKDKAAQRIQERQLRSDLEQLQKEKAGLINNSAKVASENQFYREQIDLLTREEQMVRARWVEAHKSTQRLKDVEKELQAQGELLQETRVQLQHEACSRKVLTAELNGFKQREAAAAKEKGLLEVQIQHLREQEKTDRDALVLTERQLEEKKNELKLLQESYTGLKENISQGELSNQQLRAELDRVRLEVLVRDREIREVRDLLQKTESVLESSEQKAFDLNAEYESLRSQAIEGTVVSAMDHVDQLTSDSLNSKNHSRKVEEQKHNLELQFQALSSMNKQLLEEVTQFNNKRGQKKRRVWQQQIRQAKSEAEQSQLLARKLQQDLISKNDSVHEMSERLKQVEEAFAQVSEQLNATKQEASAVSVQLQSTKIESEERRLKLKELEDSGAKLQFRLDSLTNELELLRSKPEGIDKEAHQRVVDELEKAQGNVKKLQGELSASDNLVSESLADVQTLPELKGKLRDIEEQLSLLGGYLQTPHESFQSNADEFTRTLSRLKSECQEIVVLTGQEMTALKRQVEQLHDMNYLLKVQEIEGQTKTLETQVKLVEALRTLNGLQKGSDPEQADKFAEELVAAEASLQASRQEAKELSRTLMTVKNHPVIQAEADPEALALERVRDDLLLEQKKSADYLSQINTLKMQFVRQHSEMPLSEIPDEDYPRVILEVVKKYIAVDEHETRLGAGLEAMLTEPLDYIHRIDDYDDDARDWEIELAGEEALESWQQALNEEQLRSRAYFKELMALRTYLIAELEYRGLTTKALEWGMGELQDIIVDQLRRDGRLKDSSQTISPTAITMLSSLQSTANDPGSLQLDDPVGLIWDYSDFLDHYSGGFNDLTSCASDDEDNPPSEYDSTQSEVDSLEDSVENETLWQQLPEDLDYQEEFYLYQQVSSAVDELEKIDRELEELDWSESSDEETGPESPRVRLEQRKQKLIDWLRQEDAVNIMQKFR
ncbi:hypothetical protein [Endozoicomonas sp. ALC020]|uniref:hypothetical protein n=1 Tax=unclassified Endozoicomonas TaxID=2644528 RepID=UPI003BB19050